MSATKLNPWYRLSVAITVAAILGVALGLLASSNAAQAAMTSKCGYTIEKWVEQLNAPAGSVLVYHVIVTRDGAPVRGATIQDVRGKGTTGYGSVRSGNVASGGGSEKSTTFDLGDMQTGDSVELVYEVQVDRNLSSSQEWITNFVQMDNHCHVSLDHMVWTGNSTDTTYGNPNSQSISEPINAGTGEYYTLPTRDLGLGGPFALGLRRTYASGLAEEGLATSALGRNWVHSYDMQLLERNAGLRTLVSEGGATVSFILLYLDEDRAWSLNHHQEPVPYQLTTDRAENFWLLDPLRNEVYRFDESGVLQEILDRNHNRLAFSRDPRGGWVTQLADGLGHELIFEYDDGHLTQVSDGTREIVLGYDADGALATATDAQGNQTAYAYEVRGDAGPLMRARTRPLGNTPYTQTYDDAGRVVRQVDAAGAATSIVYDSPVEGDTTVTYPDGATRRLRHVDGRLCTEIEDPAGNVTAFQYDDRHRLVAITDRMGDSTSVTYHEPSGNLASYTDAMNNTTSYEYSPREQRFVSADGERDRVDFTMYHPSRIIYADSTEEVFELDDHGNVTSYRNRAGGEWSHTYNDHGQPLTITVPGGGTATYTYNEDGSLASAGDTDTQETGYEYDALGRLAAINRPDGGQARLAHDSADRLVSYTDEMGGTTRLEYDANGNLVRSTDPLSATVQYEYDEMDRLVGATDPGGHRTSYTYDAMGNLSSLTDRNGHTYTLIYDSRGWLVELTDPEGGAWSVERDAEGVPTAFGSPSGRRLVIETDALGRPTAATDAEGGMARLTYDALSRITSRVDRLGRTTTYDYDEAGRMSSVTAPDGASASYVWSAAGRLTSITDLRGREWALDYTPMGRQARLEDPLGNSWLVSERYPDGKVEMVLFPDGAEAELRRGATGQVLAVAYDDGTVFDYEYDAAGRLLVTHGVELQYDARGDVVQSSDEGALFEADYDAGRRLIELAYDGVDAVRVRYEYDGRGLPTRISDELSGVWMSFSYDVDGQLTHIERSNGVHTLLTHNAAGRVTALRDEIDETVVAEQSYSLDAEGNVVQESRQVPLPAAVPELVAFESAYDAANQPSAPGYAHDPRGRQTEGRDASFEWNDAGRLVGIENGASSVDLEYNGLGHLRRRTENDRTVEYHHSYALPGFPIVAEKEDGSWKRLYVRAPDGSLAFSVEPATGDVRFYHFDRVGSTAFLTDGAGSVTDAYAYTPYGVLVGHTGPSDQPFTYVGRFGVRFEPTGGIYQMGARYYDPHAARFLSRDPRWPMAHDPRHLNPYAYAYGNPLRFVDPQGTQSDIPGDWVSVSGPSTFAEAWGDPIPPVPGAIPGQTPGVWILPGPSTFEEAWGTQPGEGQTFFTGESLGYPTEGGGWQPSMAGPLPGWQQQAGLQPFGAGGGFHDLGWDRQSPLKGDLIWPPSPFATDFGWNSLDPLSPYGLGSTGGSAGTWDQYYNPDPSDAGGAFTNQTVGDTPLWPSAAQAGNR